MPAGGHKGGVFPISGYRWGVFSRYKKRGMYQLHREDVFTPQWGYNYAPQNLSPLPDGSSRTWGDHILDAWRATTGDRSAKLYAVNELRYILPACRAMDSAKKSYIMDILEPSNGITYSGIGRHDVQMRWLRNQNSKQLSFFDLYSPRHIRAAILSGEARNSAGKLDKDMELSSFLPGRIQTLYKIVCDLPIWSNEESRKGSNTESRFPFVDESSTIIRELPLAEILSVKSNYRMKHRRHPIWLARQYAKMQLQIPYLYRCRLLRNEARRKANQNMGLD